MEEQPTPKKIEENIEKKSTKTVITLLGIVVILAVLLSFYMGIVEGQNRGLTKGNNLCMEQYFEAVPIEEIITKLNIQQYNNVPWMLPNNTNIT